MHDPRTEAQRALLRHLVATLAYRAGKVLRDVPDGFATFSGGPTMRTPVQIVAHLGDLMEWGIRMVDGVYEWRPQGDDDWDAQVARFFNDLEALDRAIASAPALGYPAEIIFQGPIADALTHVGQLAMLRGVAGAPVRPESYARAEIVVGRVGLDQAAPRREFDGDASARRAPA
ncbi:MAG TPA: hypothetical protein VF178_13025 [Gemmatimonadaceae bacterium]